MPPVLESFFYQIKISLKNLAETLQNPQTEFGEILEQHIVLAETLASSADNAGKVCYGAAMQAEVPLILLLEF